jgi:esterase/lipase superfamily enzyme
VRSGVTVSRETKEEVEPMYVVTNRAIKTNTDKLDELFGPKLNSPPDELRLAEITGSPGRFQFEICSETKAMREGKAPWPSEKLFKQLHERMLSDKGKDVVFFIHGYNTTFLDAVKTAYQIEKKYNVEVILFSWPSDGKLLRYRGDKGDAVASHLALDRTLERLSLYMNKYIRSSADVCGRGFSMMAHSMGNYLFKFLMKSSMYQGETLIFDNVILCAADVNEHDHTEWVEKIQVRNRVYVTINEDDRALAASRIKFGEKQKARLGHVATGKKAPSVIYLDFTNASGVKDSHSYFVDAEPLKNAHVKKVFHTILHGQRIERTLKFEAATQTYVIA